MKKLCFWAILLMVGVQGLGQYSFFDAQKSYGRVASAIKNRQDTLQKQLNKSGLQWQGLQIYIRSFKYDSQLEVWARNNISEVFKLFKTYKVCALSGNLGPKRIEGDYQVPEGFYLINEFNPKSTYHLSLGINYPNESDAFFSDSSKPGGDIYVHGSCITVGCIPIMNEQIEELYLLATQAKSQGQDFIPVHIFPVRFNREKSVEYLESFSKSNKNYSAFVAPLKKAYEYFEKHKKLPIIGVNNKGEYEVL